MIIFLSLLLWDFYSFFFIKKSEETSVIVMRKIPKKNPGSSCNHSWRNNRSYQQVANKYHSVKLNWLMQLIESFRYQLRCFLNSCFNLLRKSPSIWHTCWFTLEFTRSKQFYRWKLHNLCISWMSMWIPYPLQNNQIGNLFSWKSRAQVQSPKCETEKPENKVTFSKQ